VAGEVFAVVYPGGFEIVEGLAAAARVAEEKGGVILACSHGELVVLQPVSRGSWFRAVRGGRGVARGGRGPQRAARVAAVFDQMFRGFADVVGREAPGAEMHEVVGRGLRGPVRAGRVVKWPARDDFDVLEIVRGLAGEGKIVVFFTGDKKLARQAEALGDERIRVHYMPPSEYAGKEDLARAMIEAVREALAEAGDEEPDGGRDND